MIEDLRIMQQVIDMAVGIPKYTYQMNKNAPRPNGDYAAVLLKKVKPEGKDTLTYFDDPLQGLVQRSVGLRTLEFYVLFSRDNVEVEKFNNAFYRPDIRQFLDVRGYALMERYPLETRDKKFETDWEVRTGLTVLVSTVRITDTVITPIEVVEIDGIYNEGSH